MDFGPWLKRIRDKLGLSQTAFADRIGLKARETVGKWESTARLDAMRGANVEALLAFLGYADIEEMDRARKSDTWPDMTLLRTRLGAPRAVYQMNQSALIALDFSARRSDPAFRDFRAMHPTQILDALSIGWGKLSADQRSKAIKAATGIAGKISGDSPAPKPKAAAYNMQSRGKIKRHPARDPDAPLEPRK
jgi:transcriptional regulator with XRE-family HTH domain